MAQWDGEDYQARFDALAGSGRDLHGEADFVHAYRPRTVLDMGCGTGRVAIELARRGVDVVGVDPDPSMLATARRLAPDLDWVLADGGEVTLDRTFDVVVMAGNVPLFTPAGTTAALVAGCARHTRPEGLVIAGFSLDQGYGLDRYDAEAAAAGLEPAERYATWDRDGFDGGEYAVSVHRRPAG